MTSINNFKLLTIIIPTYNRCKQVEENINLVLPQIVRNKDKVRLYISDNASSDGTDNMIKPYLEQNSDVMFYFRQPQNITASPNFNHAVHAVNSEYVYILGDDDYVIPTFVETVLCLINDHPDVGLFHFNYILGLKNMQKGNLFQPAFNPSMKVLYSSGKEFIMEHLNRPSFISSSLFKKQLWLDGFPYMKEDCPGYVWFSILLFGCINYKCMYYQAPMLIQNFPTNNPYSANWPLYYIYGLGHLFAYLDEQIPGVLRHWQSYQQDDNKKEFEKILITSCNNKVFYRNKKTLLEKYIKNTVDKWLLRLSLSCIPRFFMNYIVFNIIRLQKLNKILS